MKEYYVYVYIDPRNFEEFYYGKGKGSRKNAHLYENGDYVTVNRTAYFPYPICIFDGTNVLRICEFFNYLFRVHGFAPEIPCIVICNVM